MSTNQSNIWSKQHLDELERLFPEAINERDTTELLLNSGKRAVVNHVRQKYLIAAKVNAIQ
jgi:hypothetical protein